MQSKGDFWVYEWPEGSGRPPELRRAKIPVRMDPEWWIFDVTNGADLQKRIAKDAAAFLSKRNQPAGAGAGPRRKGRPPREPGAADSEATVTEDGYDSEATESEGEGGGHKGKAQERCDPLPRGAGLRV